MAPYNDYELAICKFRNGGEMAGGAKCLAFYVSTPWKGAIFNSAETHQLCSVPVSLPFIWMLQIDDKWTQTA